MNFQETVYKELDFISGSLYDAGMSIANEKVWVDKGEWLIAAERAGADKIFFIENNPVIVFAQSNDDLYEKAKTFNKMWCLSRPRFLFLYMPGHLDIYDLAQKPINLNKELKDIENRAVLKHITQVSVKLLEFHRDNIESGKIYGDERFGVLENRADQALIRDIKEVRQELINSGLSGQNLCYAHALIGRSIFIRYMEDRGILTEEYFINIAQENSKWIEIINNPSPGYEFDCSNTTSFYPRILSDKTLTYTLFKKLAFDFNGDMFPEIEKEQNIITQEHLCLIQGLLYGDVGIQKKLFFFSYNFAIIPLELISSIYEEFYAQERAGKRRKEGAYYTPPVLVEFMLSRILTPEELKKKPRILDPACGSGIFLVEAFRRIVRYEYYKKGTSLTIMELMKILKHQLSGIEVNQEAAKIAAFSLYLSLFHYLNPPAIYEYIKQGNKLPYLIASAEKSTNHYHCILSGNTFDIQFIEKHTHWQKYFGNNNFDFVIGNPPWGSIGKDQIIILNWCTSKQLPIGDKEYSQAFLWRTLDFLKDKGKAGLLISDGIFFKHNTTTQNFKEKWFDCVTVLEVFNFSHVRQFFFKGGISPFAALFFAKNKSLNNHIPYWSVKQNLLLKKSQAILLSILDRQILHDQDITKTETWKINLWGGVGDERFLKHLSIYPKLIDFVDRVKTGQGLIFKPAKNESEEIQVYKFFPIDRFTRYDELDKLQFRDLPNKVYRLGTPSVYIGQRLLIKRGIDEKGTDKGRITARYEDIPFCFTNAINGIKLISSEEWKYKLILGIFWSSFARYYFFMISSTWGRWRHELHLDDEILQIPVVLKDKNDRETIALLKAVDKLLNYHPKIQTIIDDGVPEDIIKTTRAAYEKELDEAVFVLYELNSAQRDLIYDFCKITLPFYYKPFKSIAVEPAVKEDEITWISQYLHIFCRYWNTYLSEDEEMRSQIHIGAHENLIALEFFPVDKDEPWELKLKYDSWQYVLDQLNKSFQRPMGSSKILIDTVVHIVSDTGIFIIKRNEKRYWTGSLAREDAESTLCKRMIDTRPKITIGK